MRSSEPGQKSFVRIAAQRKLHYRCCRRRMLAECMANARSYGLRCVWRSAAGASGCEQYSAGCQRLRIRPRPRTRGSVEGHCCPQALPGPWAGTAARGIVASTSSHGPKPVESWRAVDQSDVAIRRWMMACIVKAVAWEVAAEEKAMRPRETGGDGLNSCSLLHPFCVRSCS